MEGGVAKESQSSPSTSARMMSLCALRECRGMSMLWLSVCAFRAIELVRLVLLCVLFHLLKVFLRVCWCALRCWCVTCITRNGIVLSLHVFFKFLVMFASTSCSVVEGSVPNCTTLALTPLTSLSSGSVRMYSEAPSFHMMVFDVGLHGAPNERVAVVWKRVRLAHGHLRTPASEQWTFSLIAAILDHRRTENPT